MPDGTVLSEVTKHKMTMSCCGQKGRLFEHSESYQWSLIARANDDFLFGGEGDDRFYIDPRTGINVETGPGADTIVIDQYSETTNNAVTITDAEDEDVIRFYNPATNFYLDVPYGDAKAVIIAKKG